MSRLAWATLVVAALFEIVWAVNLEYADGFSNLRASAVVVVAMALSVGLLSRAVQTLPVGTAYAVWTGIGAVGTAILGIVLFDEPATAVRLGCIATIVAGIVGLQVTA
ncbi:quaternary ammonium compound-resistance protein SugE [Halogranum rubrum]|uniref:Quaternary ammonium compound-resistance protein SugE n=2 Tax=Halogranum rubrum TaxID=553466 RepID=A0A1I4HFN3_9EURY|nr:MULTISPECIES: multidrug efflux SMR transporter [Halogranum]EJN59877.1 sugE protein [Halogranum salarium B-1]SFL41015.1 quaternary ammonium compound-resistance protein SugE [Halogranum rubrum]